MAYKGKQSRKQKGNTAATGYSPYLEFRGLYTRVAKRQNVSRQFVQQVAKGFRKSKRIRAALSREIKRIRKAILLQEAA